MRKVAIVGGETHIGEVTSLKGKQLEIVACAVRPDQAEWAATTFACPVVTDYRELLTWPDIDLVAVANENDRKVEVITAALGRDWDVIVDKPLAITSEEQTAIEGLLERSPRRSLLMLLTLRGQPAWSKLRQLVQQGIIGRPVFTHVRMAVQLKRAQRPPWFLDSRKSGGLFLDLLIHGLDYVEWLTGRQITALTAATGNLGNGDDPHIRDHGTVFCELDDGSTAVVEGQRMLPKTQKSDYRVLVAGTQGHADLLALENKIMVTSPQGAGQEVTDLPAPVSVVADFLAGGTCIGQKASLRANRLALMATCSAREHRRILMEGDPQ